VCCYSSKVRLPHPSLTTDLTFLENRLRRLTEALYPCNLLEPPDSPRSCVTSTMVGDIGMAATPTNFCTDVGNAASPLAPALRLWKLAFLAQLRGAADTRPSVFRCPLSPGTVRGASGGFPVCHSGHGGVCRCLHITEAHLETHCSIPSHCHFWSLSESL
jgi:hypothetical protein